MDVFLVNESSHVTVHDAWNIAWALDRQARFHFGRSGWRSDLRCVYMPPDRPIPAGGAILHLEDTIDVAGALGYHDEDGNEIPFGRVGVLTAQQAGDELSEVCSHELMELGADPHVNLSALTGDSSRLYALEVGDPVQGTGYDVGAPEGKTLGITVANFALPSYFDPHFRKKVDFRGVLAAPFTIAAQGYMSYIDTNNFAQGWQQQFGAERTAPATPDRDDRLGRR